MFWLQYGATTANPSFLQPLPPNKIHLLRLLGALLGRRTVQPDSNKCEPSKNGNPDTANPHPRTANLETPWVFIVCKVPDGDLSLLVNVGDEWTAVVNTEVENSVLVRCLESGTEDGSVFCLSNWGQIEAVER